MDKKGGGGGGLAEKHEVFFYFLAATEVIPGIDANLWDDIQPQQNHYTLRAP